MKEKRELEDFPVVDLGKFLEKDKNSGNGWEVECKKVASLLHRYGCLVVKDPRVDESENEKFINQMEKYYERPKQQKTKDIRTEVHYQVGATPDGVEQARDHCAAVKELPESERPLTLCPPEADPKWRFFWRMGEQPPKTEFAQLNAAPVIPENFPGWADVMNKWGGLMLQTIFSLAEMVAIGFDMAPNTFTSLMKYGPHLLAPTGGDLGHPEYGKLGTVFANYHYDLNFLTIHGKSRFAGLFVWTREGKRYPVRVPSGCLLVQAGKQFEWLTGGHGLAGFHEVIVSPDTIAAVEKAKTEKRSMWRVSSTLFSHIASDNLLTPLGRFATKDACAKYPATKAGTQVQDELDKIKLGQHVRPADDK